MGIYDREYYRDDEDGPSVPALGLPRSLVVRLIVVNVAIHFVNLFFGGSDGWFVRQLELPAQTFTTPWTWWRFVSYAFVHNPHNLGHLLSNMISLWFFGREIENLHGPREMLRFYLVAALLGGVVWAARQFLWGNSRAVLLGASGAVTAVIILFVCHFPRQQVHLFGVFPVPAWVLGVLLVGGDLFSAGARSASGVAYDVHLVGAAFGFAYYHWSWNLGRYLPSLPRWSRRSFTSPRPDLKIHEPAEVDSDSDSAYRHLDEDADRILAKLHAQGDASLTPEERSILEAYSRRMRQKHR